MLVINFQEEKCWNTEITSLDKNGGVAHDLRDECGDGGNWPVNRRRSGSGRASESLSGRLPARDKKWRKPRERISMGHFYVSVNLLRLDPQNFSSPFPAPPFLEG